MKKIICFLCIIGLLAAITPNTVEAYIGGTDEPEYDNVIEINNAEDLLKFTEDYNKGTFDNKHLDVELKSDIDMTGKEWTPINNDVTGFDDLFNGNGHTISNLTINAANDEYVGFIKILSGGKICNLNIVNVSFSDKTGYHFLVGGVAGLIINKSIVENCNVYNLTIDEEEGHFAYVGGIAGVNDRSTIINCNAINVNLIGDSNVGGIAGLCYYGNITNCFSSGTTKCLNSVGGLCGEVSNGSIINCGTTSTVTSDGEHYAGGFCGHADNAEFKNCYSTGDVYAELDTSIDKAWNAIGVFIGGMTLGSIDSCYSDSNASLYVKDKNGNNIDYSRVMVGKSDLILQYPDASFEDKVIEADFTDAEVTNNLATKYNEFVKAYNDKNDGNALLSYWKQSDDKKYLALSNIPVTVLDRDGNVLETLYAYYGQSINSLLPKTAPVVQDYAFSNWKYKSEIVNASTTVEPNYYLNYLKTDTEDANSIEGNLGEAVKFTVNRTESTGESFNKVCNSLKVLLKSNDVDADNTAVYDISILNTDNVKVQPNGDVTITLALPEGLLTKDLHIYRIGDDGQYIELKYEIKDGKVVFTTDHFSYYVFTTATVAEPSVSPETKTPGSNTDGDNNNGVKTGDSNNILGYVFLAIAGVAVVTVLGNKKLKDKAKMKCKL